MLPKLSRAHGSETRNIINAAIDSINLQGKSIQDLVAEGQLTPEQYASLIKVVNGNISKGDITVYDIDKNKGKFDQSFLTSELLAQIAGDAPVLSEVAPGSVTLDKLAIIKESTNKYDKDKVVEGSLNRENGEIKLEDGFITSDFIQVNKADNYFIKISRAIVYYDANHTFLSADPDANPKFDYVVSPPSGAAYMRVTWGINDLMGERQQVNAGTTQLPYEGYYIYIDNKYTEQHEVTADSIINQSINYKKTDFLNLGKNLFNPGTVTIGKYVVPTSGALKDNEFYLTSDGIEVESGGSYVANQDIRFLAFYKDTGEHVSGLGDIVAGTVINIPSTANIIRVSFLKDSLNSFQLEKGTSVTTFERYGYVMPKLLNENSGSSETPETDKYGKWNMKNYISQASKYEDESFNDRLEIAIIGDSWVRSKHRVTVPLRNELTERYGNAGLGFVGFAEIRLAPGETQIATTGTWAAVDKVKGLDMRQYESAVAGSTITLTTYEQSDELEIHHIQQTGSYRYRVDGGAWTTVDTSAGTVSKKNSFTPGDITIEIEVLSGTVTLLNAYLFNGSRGAVIHQWGYGGATASDFAGINRSHFISEFRKTNIKSVGIVLGTNDMAQNVGLDDFNQNISEIIDRIKTADSLVDVFLVAPSGNNLSRALTMKAYDEELQKLAIQKDISYVSLYKNMGTYAEQNARGLFEDDVHPNEDGGRIIGNIVYDRLLRM